MVTSHSGEGGAGGSAVGADLGRTLSPPLGLVPRLGRSGRQLCARATCREGCPVATEGRRAALFMPEDHSILRGLCRVPPQNTENG